MTGERDLTTLLQNLRPILTPGVYVFCSVPHDETLTAETRPLATVHEPEGLTMVLFVEEAQRLGLTFDGRFRCIRLDVHSSLEAVGLTARVATALAREDISANMLAGAYHDHLLGPEDRATDAMSVLSRLG